MKSQFPAPLSIFRNFFRGFQISLYSLSLLWYNLNKYYGLYSSQKRIHQKHKTVAPQRIRWCIFFGTTVQSRQNLCVTIVIRRFCIS